MIYLVKTVVKINKKKGKNFVLSLKSLCQDTFFYFFAGLSRGVMLYS